jgi:ketosteroid isomerase-like protein
MQAVHASVAIVSFDEPLRCTHPVDMSNHTYAAYAAAEPYFRLVRGALGDRVQGEHFFDVVDEHTLYEVRYDLGGWPRIVRGREALLAQFRGYVQAVELHAADHLVVHETDGGRVIVIEYEVRGTILANRAAYENRFCSIIRIEKRKIAHWRDYMDSLAAWNAFRA